MVPPKWGVLVKLKASALNWRCNRSVIAKSRKRPKSQLKVPGPRKLLKPELPSEPGRHEPGLFGSNVSANANGSYQKPDLLPSFFGEPKTLIMVGELPGQAAPQSPQTLNG